MAKKQVAKSDPPLEGKVVIDTAPNAEMQARTKALVTLATKAVVATPAQLVDATSALARIQTARRFIADVYRSAKAPLLQAQRTLNEQERDLLGPLTTAEKMLQSRILSFQDGERERATKLLEEARDASREAAKADQDARAEKLREAASQARTKEARQSLERAADAISAAEPIPAPVEVPQAASLIGAHAVERHKASVVDLRALVLEVAAKLMLTHYGGAKSPTVAAYLSAFGLDGHATLDCLRANEPELNRMAFALRADLRISGVEVVKDRGIVTRSR